MRWLVILLLAGSLLRLGFWFVYGPVAYPDTGTYMVVAQNILAGDFSNYEGRRSPGYPLVLAIARMSPHGAWAIQLLMGLATSVLLFYVAFALTRRPAFSALVGMTYNLNLPQLFFEANLISETTATFAISGVAALLLVSYRRLRDERRVWPWVLGLGLVAAFATLTRPQFVFLPLLIATLIGYVSQTRAGARFSRSVGYAGLVCVASAVLILGWCGFNYAKVGFFTISTQTGIGLMEHSLAFIELAPDRYARIRDIYLRYGDEKRAQRGRRTVSFEGLPEAMAATGLSLPALSMELARMSVGMFVRHPIRYAWGVAHAWVDFWPAPMYWQPAMLRFPSLERFIALAWRLEQPLIRLANAVFLGLVAVVTLSPALRRRLHWDLHLTTLAAIVLLTSLVQALAIWAENARYAISVQPLVILIVVVAALRLAAPARKTIPRSPAPTPPGGGRDTSRPPGECLRSANARLQVTHAGTWQMSDDVVAGALRAAAIALVRRVPGPRSTSRPRRWPAGRADWEGATPFVILEYRGSAPRMIPPGVRAHPTALVESDRIGEGTRIWAGAHVMKGAVIGRDCNLGDGAFVETGAILGDRVTVKNGVCVWEGVTVGDRAFLGPACVLTNDLTPRSGARDRLVPLRIGEGASLGANCTVLAGTVVGAWSMVGAATVVTRDVPPHALVLGNPGRVAGWVCRCGLRLEWWPSGARAGHPSDEATCACGGRYVRVPAGVEERVPGTVPETAPHTTLPPSDRVVTRKDVR